MHAMRLQRRAPGGSSVTGSWVLRAPHFERHPFGACWSRIATWAMVLLTMKWIPRLDVETAAAAVEGTCGSKSLWHTGWSSVVLASSLLSDDSVTGWFNDAEALHTSTGWKLWSDTHLNMAKLGSVKTSSKCKSAWGSCKFGWEPVLKGVLGLQWPSKIDDLICFWSWRLGNTSSLVSKNAWCPCEARSSAGIDSWAAQDKTVALQLCMVNAWICSDEKLRSGTDAMQYLKIFKAWQ